MLPALDPFVERWLASTRSERADRHAFLRELFLALEVPVSAPSPGGNLDERYVLDREVRFTPPGGGEVRGTVDLYKEGCFVLQVKKDHSEGSLVPGARRGRRESWHNAMVRTRAEAIDLARSFERRPPFVVVCDIGRCFDLHACFDGSGRYRPFPDGEANRLPFGELRRHGETLRALWIDPCSLDPSKRAVHIAEEAAASLASLAEALRAAGHPPAVVADFVLDCLFALAAEDFGLLPSGVFRETLEAHWLAEPEAFPEGFARLWQAMGDTFAGRLFERPRALPLSECHLRQLLAATRFDWSDVDPAVLGEKIMDALDPPPAGFTGRWRASRGPVETLVQAVVEAPLRSDWDAVRAEVWLCHARDDLRAAARALDGFRARLADIRVFDPACGTGDFLCAALRFLQQLDGETRAELRALGEVQEIRVPSVGPAQLCGHEIHPRTVKVARLMIWLTHLRRRASASKRKGPAAEPLPWELSGIEPRDALLSYDALEALLDGKGRPVPLRHRDARPTSDPAAVSRVPYIQYIHPRRAEWPAADFIVGYPPFMGSRVMPLHLGEGYVTALRTVYPEVPGGAELAAYWWSRTAALAREGAIRRFGFLLPSTFGAVARRLLVADTEEPEKQVRIVLAVPDQAGDVQGLVRVSTVVAQRASEPLPSHALLGGDDGAGRGVSYRAVPRIGAHLRAGPGVESARPLAANAGLCFRGIWLGGSGFVLRPDDGSVEHTENPVTHLPVVRPYLMGRDLMGRREGPRVIDFHGLDAARAEAVSPQLFRRVLLLVQPDRERMARAALRERWWQFGNDARGFRESVKDLKRYIATSQIAKHRVFVFLDREILPDSTLACLALDDAHFLGVLSSRVHTLWASAAGARLAGASRYDATCFQPFPFPACTELSKRAIREVAEALDAHRKDSLAREPDLTLTEMYNLLSMKRSSAEPDPRGGRRRGTAAIAILRQFHDELDRAVLDAYGWPRHLSDEELLERIVSLNQERAREEQAGLVRWLRPRFQGGEGDRPPRPEPLAEKDVEEMVPPPAKGLSARFPWPVTPNEQIVRVRDLVATSSHAWSTAEIASVFKGAKKRAVAEILDALAATGVLRASGSAHEPRWSLVEGGWT